MLLRFLAIFVYFAIFAFALHIVREKVNLEKFTQFTHHLIRSHPKIYRNFHYCKLSNHHLPQLSI